MNNFIKLYLLSSLSLSFINADTTKFGLGSALIKITPNQFGKQLKRRLGLFCFLRDNVYGDLPSGLKKNGKVYKTKE